MKQPINAIKPDTDRMTRRELRMYAAVLADNAAWNDSLKWLVNHGDLDPQREIEKIQLILGDQQ